MNQTTRWIRQGSTCVWESCKWISESNQEILVYFAVIVWESCKWISESN